MKCCLATLFLGFLPLMVTPQPIELTFTPALGTDKIDSVIVLNQRTGSLRQVRELGKN